MSRAADKPKHEHQVFYKLNAVSEGSEKDQERYLRTRSSIYFIV